jgi:hypothetical protein
MSLFECHPSMTHNVWIYESPYPSPNLLISPYCFHFHIIAVNSAIIDECAIFIKSTHQCIPLQVLKNSSDGYIIKQNSPAILALILIYP